MENNLNPIILCIETSTKQCSVSISKGRKCIDSKSILSEQYSHSEYLHLFIDEILKENNLKADDIQAVAINTGPGSFTGLRIGVATAKTLCYGLKIPIISLSTFEIMIYPYLNSFKNIICCVDARRMDVYCVIKNDKIEILKEFEGTITINQEFIRNYDKPNTLFICDKIDKFKCFQSEYITYQSSYPLADNMLPITYEKFKNKAFDNLFLLTPNYKKPVNIGNK